MEENTNGGDGDMEVEVKCVVCEKKEWVGPQKDQPFCECGNVMVPTGKARDHE